MKAKSLHNIKRASKAIIISPILLPYVLILLLLAGILSAMEIVYDTMDGWARDQIDSSDSLINRMAEWINKP